jgi:hypothetical protein
VPARHVDNVGDGGGGEQFAEFAPPLSDPAGGVAPSVDDLRLTDDGEVLSGADIPAMTVAPLSTRANRSTACMVWSSRIWVKDSSAAWLTYSRAPPRPASRSVSTLSPARAANCSTA